MSIDQVILNAILISIPEELFVTIMALIIMKRYEYLDRYCFKKNIFRILFIVVIPISIFSNVTLHILGLGEVIRLILNLLVLSLLICVLLRSNKFFEVTLYTMLSMVIFMITQLITMVIVVYILKSPESINQTAFLNFKLFLPERIFEYGLLYIIFLRKNLQKNISIAKLWKENKALRGITFTISFANLFICLVAYNSFVNEMSLIYLPKDVQMLMVLIVFILIFVNLTAPWIIIFSLYPSENHKKI